MYGENPVRKKEKGDRYQVAEIFYTIQGEGPFSGQAATFIRLTGCNMQCDFCDTIWDDDQDPYLTVEAILAQVAAVQGDGADLIVITGGEPSRWPLTPLIFALTGEDYRVQIETNGSFYHQAYLAFGVTVVCSPKTPSVNKDVAKVVTHWKYPLANGQLNPEDGLPLDVARPKWVTTGTHIYVTPMDVPNVERFNRNCAAVVQSAQDFGYVAQVQVHKILSVR